MRQTTLRYLLTVACTLATAAAWLTAQTALTPTKLYDYNSCTSFWRAVGSAEGRVAVVGMSSNSPTGGSMGIVVTVLSETYAPIANAHHPGPGGNLSAVDAYGAADGSTVVLYINSGTATLGYVVVSAEGEVIAANDRNVGSAPGGRAAVTMLGDRVVVCRRELSGEDYRSVVRIFDATGALEREAVVEDTDLRSEADLASFSETGFALQTLRELVVFDYADGELRELDRVDVGEAFAFTGETARFFSSAINELLVQGGTVYAAAQFRTTRAGILSFDPAVGRIEATDLGTHDLGESAWACLAHWGGGT